MLIAIATMLGIFVDCHNVYVAAATVAMATTVALVVVVAVAL